MSNRTWSHDETLLAFLQYCKMEFGKIHHNNPIIIEFAELLGRTPSSVTMKMGNLARFDPELQKRGVKGLTNGSKMEEVIWNEFQNNSTDMILYGEKLLGELKKQTSNSNSILQDESDAIPPGSSQEIITKGRIGQRFFRQTILASYGKKCCITGVNNTSFLIASHIKPWKVSDDHTEKTNPRNGLCLNVFHDKAFDQGFITIDLKFCVVVSSKLKEIEADEKTYEWLLSCAGNQIHLPEKFVPDKQFIQYHNDVIYKG